MLMQAMSNPSLDKFTSIATHYLAIDLGAESGRVILGSLKSFGNSPVQKLELNVLHRFANIPLQSEDTLKWDLASLWREIKVGLKMASELGLSIASLSTDTWGVDYVLFRAKEPMVSATNHYRDSRTDGVYEKIFPRVSADFIFAETGIQFMPINTVFQLFMESQLTPEKLVYADSFLNIADYFNFLLSGKVCSEATLASTSQLYNPLKKNWSFEIIDKIGAPKNLFPTVVEPGTEIGLIQSEFAQMTGISNAVVIASCSHDTAAAIAAVPFLHLNENPTEWAFLSSGTWSLLGTELLLPKINAQCREMNFTNEVGYNGTIMLRKNIVGLWILQECKRDWAETGQDYSYEALTQMSVEAPSFKAIFRPDDGRFGKPGKMIQKISNYLKETGQAVSTEPGLVVRCILESLALLYAETLQQCEIISEKKFTKLHLVGGGSRNQVLNQLTANATGITVCAGPAEATAIGNILIQANTLGHVTGKIRTVVANSVETTLFYPQDREAWKCAAKTFSDLPMKA